MITYDDFVNYGRDSMALSDDAIALAMFLIEEDYGDLYEALSEHGYVEGSPADEDAEVLYDIWNEYEPEDYGRNEYKVGSRYYYIFDDEDDARKAAIDLALTILPDQFADGGWIPDVGIDKDWFADAMKESYESYAEDISNEGDGTFENRLVSECFEAGLIDDTDFEEDEDGEPDYMSCIVPEYDLVDRLSDHLCEDYGDDPIQWYKDNFGDDSFAEVVEYHNLIDWDEVAADVVDTDGVEPWLARYDGYGHDFNFDGIDYNIYRE